MDNGREREGLDGREWLDRPEGLDGQHRQGPEITEAGRHPDQESVGTDVPLASRRDWLHETGLHGKDAEAAAELGALTASATPVRPVAVPEPGENRSRIGREELDEAAAATESAGRAVGWAALLFSITALFIWPLLMGATSAVLGYIAFRQGARSLGVWSMTLGIIAVASYFVLIPLLTAFT